MISLEGNKAWIKDVNCLQVEPSIRMVSFPVIPHDRVQINQVKEMNNSIPYLSAAQK